MQAFLERVITHILNNKNTAVESSCFVFPNRRTGLYLKKYMAENINRTIFSPAFYTIDDFASEISGLHTEDNLILLSYLYQSYKETIKEEKTAVYNFENFISWGNMLLSDFNDIDSYLAAPDKVFEYLSEAKAITLWNPDNPVLTPLQKDYLKFYKSLGAIYKVFTTKLLANKIAYQGLMFKQIVDSKLYKSYLNKWETIYFIGFNALSNAEEHIIEFFVKNNKAQIFFDYDQFYLNNIQSEAGFHIKKAIKRWGKSPFHDEFKYFETLSKEIHIIGVPRNIGQAKLSGLLLSQFDNTGEPNNTALILSQEDIVFPVLNAIPEHIKNVNVTMGYPLDKTSVFELFDAIISLYENAHRLLNIRKGKSIRFNVKDVLRITENAFIKLIDNKTESYVLNKILIDKNIIFYTSKEILEIINSFNVSDNLYFSALQQVFCLQKYDCKEIVAILRSTVDIIIKADIFHSTVHLDLSIEAEFVYYYTRLLKKLQVFLDTIDEDEVGSFKNLHKLIMKNLKIPFTGEPLSGLQVMGFLESRNLDFKNVFILSVNEGIMPLTKYQNSFIPIDIRRHFLLPVYYENDSIYAYHFYRLIQRAEKIHLIYNTENDTLGGGEKSRFIAQILYELSSFVNINIKQSVLTTPIIAQNNTYKISINKTDDVMALLEKKAVKGISPSSLNIFKQCSLRFYMQYIIGIRELEEPEENIDAAQLGSAVHWVLENLYKQKTAAVIEKEFYNITSEELEIILNEAFKNHSKNTDTQYGKNHLLFKIAHKYLVNFLNEEKKYVNDLSVNGQELFIESTELLLKKTFNFNTEYGPITVNLNGKVDRTDRLGDTIRIIDYKTGTVKDEDIKLNSWDKLYDDKVSEKIIQLLLYTYLYAQEYKIHDFKCGFYSLKKNRDGYMFIQFPDGETTYNEKINDAIETFLIDTFTTMFNKGIPIEQTIHKEHCKYCDFKIICNRL